MEAHKTVWWLDLLILYVVMAAIIAAVGYFLVR